MAEFIPTLERLVNDAVRAARGRALTLKEIQRALGPAGRRKSEVRQAVRALAARGALAPRGGNRWAPPGGGARRFEALLRITARGGRLCDPESGASLAEVRPEDLHLALDGDRVLAEARGAPSRRAGRAPTALVIQVLERRSETLTGRLQRGPYHAVVIPDDPRIPWNIRISDFGGLSPETGRRVAVRLDPWSPRAAMPSGALTEDLGAADDPAARRRALMRRHALEPEFPEDARDQSRRAPRAPRERDAAERLDLRAQAAFTIDPEDARDFDDAVHLRRLPDGGWELDVHIADVSHFVPPDSAIDREARARGNTVYLVEEAVLMLPAELTRDVCSLQPERDRLCHTARIHIGPDGTPRRHETFASVIRSRARLTYDAVQAVLSGDDSPDVPPAVRAPLREMHALARRLRARRLDAGALDIVTPEVRFVRDAQGAVCDIALRGCDEAYQLIEEFMLLANQAVALTLSAAGVPALYRIHEEPEEEQWSAMEAELAELGLILRERTRERINALLRGIRDPRRRSAASLAVLRNLKRARYSSHRSAHFGLAMEHYTHFTSPIRRYPDLIVHRQLKALEAGARPPYGAAELARIAAHCSARERAADEAEAESVAEARVAFFAARLRAGEIGPYAAVITGRTPRGPLVELTDSLQRGLLIETPPHHGRRRGRRPGRDVEYRLGDPLLVELARVDERRRWVDFRPATREGAATAARRDRDKTTG